MPRTGAAVPGRSRPCSAGSLGGPSLTWLHFVVVFLLLCLKFFCFSVFVSCFLSCFVVCFLVFWFGSVFFYTYIYIYILVVFEFLFVCLSCLVFLLSSFFLFVFLAF